MLLLVRNLCKDTIGRGQWQRFAFSAVISAMTMRAPSHPLTLPCRATRYRLTPGNLFSSLPSEDLEVDFMDQEGEDESEQSSGNDGEQDSEECYADRYAWFSPEPWDDDYYVDDDDDEDGYKDGSRFDDYFSQKPGHYIHPMLDRIDDLKECVRAAAKDVRARDATIANLAEAILAVAGKISQASAAVQESDAAGGKAIMKSVGQIDTDLTKAFETTGLSALGSVGDEFDPNIHIAVGDGSADTGSSKAPPGTVKKVLKIGFRLEDEVIRRAKVVVTRTPASLEPES
jgi:molecular chaperone GrpE (heat shock protein)